MVDGVVVEGVAVEGIVVGTLAATVGVFGSGGSGTGSGGSVNAGSGSVGIKGTGKGGNCIRWRAASPPSMEENVKATKKAKMIKDLVEAILFGNKDVQLAKRVIDFLRFGVMEWRIGVGFL